MAKKSEHLFIKMLFFLRNMYVVFFIKTIVSPGISLLLLNRKVFTKMDNLTLKRECRIVFIVVATHKG